MAQHKLRGIRGMGVGWWDEPRTDEGWTSTYSMMSAQFCLSFLRFCEASEAFGGAKRTANTWYHQVS
jgi:hypothetical protein